MKIIRETRQASNPHPSRARETQTPQMCCMLQEFQPVIESEQTYESE